MRHTYKSKTFGLGATILYTLFLWLIFILSTKEFIYTYAWSMIPVVIIQLSILIWFTIGVIKENICWLEDYRKDTK